MGSDTGSAVEAAGAETGSASGTGTGPETISAASADSGTGTGPETISAVSADSGTGTGSEAEAAGSAAGPVDSSGEPTRARTWPTSTTSPSSDRISVTTPAVGEGTSVSTLSVEISKRISSASTGSPTCLNQRMIVPSVTVSPNWGMVTSTADPASDPVAANLTGGYRTSTAGSSRPAPAVQPCRDRPVSDSTLSPNSSLRVG